VCLLPLQAFAQSDDGFDVSDKPAAAAPAPVLSNYIDLGAQYNSSRSYYLGRFTGAVDPGFNGIGDFHYGQKDAWDSGGTSYFDFQGDNLGMWDRSFTAKVGNQGTWGLQFSYQGIPYYATNSFNSIFAGNGQLVPGVAQGGLGVTFGLLQGSFTYKNPLGTTITVNPLYQPLYTKTPTLENWDLSTRRDVYTTTGKYEWGDWTITGGWRHEHKEGYQANSLEIGGAPAPTSAGTVVGGKNTAPTSFTSGMAYFAQPIDYDTDRFDIAAQYGNDRYQNILSYSFSNFTDNVTAFDAPNPWNFFGSTVATAFPNGPSAVQATYVLPPSNQSHQWKAQFGYNVDPTTRINLNVGYGLSYQNQPYDTGIGYNASTAQAEPRTSFDGLMTSVFTNLAITSHPLPYLDWRLAYTLDDRQNSSPQNTYIANPVSTNTASNYFTYSNLPFSVQSQKIGGEVGLRLATGVKLTLSDYFTDTRRSYTDTTDVQANLATVKLRGQIMDGLAGSISYSHEDRTAHNYNVNGWWADACNSCNTEPANFLMFFEASRKHDEVKATIDASLLPGLNVSLMGKGAQDTYPNASLGLRNNTNVSVGPDISWQVSPRLNLHAYYTYQQIFYDQASTVSSGSLGATGTGYSSTYNLNTTDHVTTLGANADWQAIPDLLKISLDASLSSGSTAYALGEGVVAYGGSITSATSLVLLNSQPLPNVTSLYGTISLHGEYQLAPNVTLMAGYAFERFSYKDWANMAGSTQYADLLLPGTVNPNEAVHVVSAMVRYKF